MSINANPESTWGKSPEQKERWVEQFAPQAEESTEVEASPVTLDVANPESTWGATVEKKVEWRESNVEGFNPENPVGGPTEVGIHDEELLRPAETPMTVDSGPAVYSGDDRAEEYKPIYVPAENSDQDYTPPENTPLPPIDNNQPQPPPVDEEPQPPANQPDQPVTNEPEPTPDVPVDPAPAPPADSSETPEFTEVPTVADASQPGPVTDAPAEPVDIPTVDGQENTANESSSTSGADVSQPGTPEEPITESTDSAAGTPEADAAQVREAASNQGRRKRSGRSDGSGVVEGFGVERK